jgi:DNA-binding LacI/PurR family transcriptional regulator/GAF domain-containing protein
MGVADAARELDVNLIQFSAGLLRGSYWYESEAYVPYELVSADLLDGLVIWGAQLGQHVGAEGIQALCTRYSPLSIVNLGMALDGIPSLLVDNYQGMHDLVTHLIEAHGYRRIAFLSGPEAGPEAQERYQAYVDALAEHDIPLDSALIATDREIVELRDRGEEGGEGAYRNPPIRVLIEGHGLQPGDDFEAVVGYNDMYCLGAMQVLQARGIHIPRDVAIVGFDDAEEAHFATPPLTTVRQSFYDMGWRAAEMLLDQIRGVKVPEKTVLSLQVIIRQSCGCLTPMVERASVGSMDGHNTRSTSPRELKAALAVHQAQALFEITQAIGKYHGGVIPDLVELLWEGFTAEITGKTPGKFLETIDDILHQSMAEGSAVNAWQDAISVLRSSVLPLLDDPATVLRAEDLWHQARLMIGDAAQRTQIYDLIQDQHRTVITGYLGRDLVTHPDIASQMDIIAQRLPGLDIPSCYLSLYENPEAPLEWSRLVLAYAQGKRVELEDEGLRFPSRQLLPDGMLPADRRYSLLVQPLHLLANQLGIVLFEEGPLWARVYEQLRQHVGNGLMEQKLVERMERRALQLQTAAEVSHVASSILDVDELIQRVVDLVRERFDLYHVGLFLVEGDESGEVRAALRAATGEAGQTMLRQGCGVTVGGDSLIGRCITTKQGCVALDIGENAVQFENPLLPDTRSELALPLVSRGEAIGALTIQSIEKAAFGEEDVSGLQTMADQLANAIVNARLFEEVQERADELAVLQEIARAMTATLDMDGVMQSIHRHTSRLMDTNNLYIALYNAQRDEVSFPFYAEGERIGRVGSRRAGNGLTEYVIRTCEPLLITDDVNARVGELGIELIGRTAYSWLGAPMVVSDQVIGVIAVQSYTTPQAYNEHHLELLSAIASQAAVATQNARLFEQAQIRTKELAVLNELGQILAARLSLDEVLEEVYRGASDLLDATNFYVALYDPVKNEVSFPYDASEEEEDRFLTLSADQGLTGYIVRHRTGVLIGENLPKRLAEMGVEMVGKPALSWLGVPIMMGKEILGVMGVQSYTTPNAYDAHDRDLLTALANQTAIAIQNAHLFEQTRASAERERYVRAVTDRIRRGVDRETIMRITLEELGKVLGADQSVIRLGTQAQLIEGQASEGDQ